MKRQPRPLASVGTSSAAGGGDHFAQAVDFHKFICNTHHTTTEDIVKRALEQCSSKNCQVTVIPKKDHPTFQGRNVQSELASHCCQQGQGKSTQC